MTFETLPQIIGGEYLEGRSCASLQIAYLITPKTLLESTYCTYFDTHQSEGVTNYTLWEKEVDHLLN